MIRSGRSSRRLRPAGTILLASAALVLVAAAGPVLAARGEPDRILVAPVDAHRSVEDDPLVKAIPALLEAAFSEGAGPRAAQVHDLSPETLSALGVREGEVPDQKDLSRGQGPGALTGKAAVRILVLPEADSKKVGDAKGYEIGIHWIDLVAGKEGTLTDSAAPGAPAIDLVGRLADSARGAWRESWPDAAPAPAGAALSLRLSESPEALAAWAAAGAAWNTGRAPDAIGLLGDALRADAGFGMAQVDLAWIRLEQTRKDEAAERADKAISGGRLDGSALDEAKIIKAAAGGDAAGLGSLADDISSRSPGSDLAPLARAWADILGEDYPPAIGLLDTPRRYRPNDPAILHLAGIAGLGSEDYYEAKTRLTRAAALWPAHEIIESDLAEAYARDHDLEGARKVLEAWATAFDPNDPPGAAEAWSVDNPPPTVRVEAIDMIEGQPTTVAKSLATKAGALKLAGAGWRVRIPVLMTLIEVQLDLSEMGSPREKQQWLDATRDTLRDIDALVPADERSAHPWIYDRIQALIRVREGRTEEAGQIRESIMKASSMPGYDPGVEAEIDAAIALKKADKKAHIAACRRAIDVRGALEDHARLAQADTIVRDWKGAEEEFDAMDLRLARWSAARRRDALLARPLRSAMIPVIYYIGGLARVYQGDALGGRERFGTFLAYYKHPDAVYHLIYADATDRGAKPAW